MQTAGENDRRKGTDDMQKGIWAGERIEELRRHKGMTQEQLAVAAGLRRTDVNRYEKNRQRLGERNGRKIARALSVELEELGNFTDGMDMRAELDQMADEVAAMREQMAELVRRLDQQR